MPCPNLPSGFDFTDPDIYTERIPVEEFAEVRATSPIWWNEQAPGSGGGFHDGGFWAITKLNDVKEVSRRSDIFSSSAKRRDPAVQQRHRARGHRGPALRHAQHGRAAPHQAAQDHLPRLHATGRRTLGGRASGAGAEDRAGRGGRGFGRLRRAGLLRAAAAGHRGPAGRAAGGSRQAVRMVERDDRCRRPGVRPHRSQGHVSGVDHVRDEDGRGAGRESGRRHRDPADRGRHRR